MNDATTGVAMGGAMLIVSAIWGIIALGYYIWYLWSLSKLFPKLGLPASHGWIPVWNLWQLIQRGDLPGWIVLLGFVPGLGLVTLVVTIMAIHRINSEHGKGAGFTVLGALLPPVWAMMLANHIGDSAHSQPGQPWQQGEYGTQNPQLPYAVGPDGFGQPGLQNPNGFQQGYHDPAANGWQGMPPVQQDPVAGGWQVASQVQGDTAWQLDAAAQQQSLAQQPPVPQPPAWPTNAAPEAAQANAYPALAPQDQLPSAQMSQVQMPPEQFASEYPSPTQIPSAPLPPAQPAGPATSIPADVPPVPTGSGVPPVTFQQPVFPAEPAPENNWGFSNTTEGAFEKLASEGAPQHGDSPLGVSSPPQELYSWPSVEPEPPVEATAVTSLPPQVPAASDPAPLPSAPAPIVAPPTQAPEVPTIFETSVSSIEASAASQENMPVQSAPAPVLSAAADEDELDHTVVVARRGRWGLELPDGEVLELLGDDIVLGRKPQALDGVTALQIPDPTRTMSKTHARMRRVGESWTIEDLQSTNGVAVFDGLGHSAQIEAGKETAVTDRLVIGTLEVRLRSVS